MAPQRKLKETYFDDNFSSSANSISEEWRDNTQQRENFKQETDVIRFCGSTYVNMHPPSFRVTLKAIYIVYDLCKLKLTQQPSIVNDKLMWFFVFLFFFGLTRTTTKKKKKKKQK